MAIGIGLQKKPIIPFAPDPPPPPAPVAQAGPLANIEKHSQWPLLAKLPLKLLVFIPLPGFKVRTLLALEPGQTIASQWKTTEDVPLTIGGVQVAFNEFEVVEHRMAIRLTRLA
jgi:flagellar motor switch protein FliN/FliY